MAVWLRDDAPLVPTLMPFLPFAGLLAELPTLSLVLAQPVKINAAPVIDEINSVLLNILYSLNEVGMIVIGPLPASPKSKINVKICGIKTGFSTVKDNVLVKLN